MYQLQVQAELPKRTSPIERVDIGDNDPTTVSTEGIASQEAYNLFAGAESNLPPVDEKYVGIDRAKLQSQGTRVGDSIRRGGIAASHLVERVDPFTPAHLKYSECAVERRRKETISGHLD